MCNGHIRSSESQVLPELFCVEFQRNQRDLGVSIVLQATCEMAAQREAIRLFPEYARTSVSLWVFPIRYVEFDWDEGRCLLIKRTKRREIPAAVAEISKSFLKNPPRLKKDGGKE